MTLLAQLSLARPWWLLALLPLAVAFWQARRSRQGEAWLRVVDAHLLPHMLTRLAARHGAATWLAALLAVLALAGPVLDDAAARNATRRDSLRVLVVDLSPGAAPHLERIKLKLHALLQRPHAGETALLVYAEEPYIVVPPTTDTGVVARFVPELDTDAMPVAGNKPERALRMATEMLARSGARTRDIVWFTAGDGTVQADSTSLAGIRLSVLHAGALRSVFLRTSAERSGGILLAMRNDDTDLNLLDDAMRAGSRDAAARGGTELGPWLLLPLLPLAALHFRHGMLVVLPVLVCAGFLPGPAYASSLADMEARRLFDTGKYAQAAGRFTDARWKAAAHYRAGRYEEAARLLEGREEADSLYNRANALAKMGRLQDALAGYEEALRLRPADADILHNRDLVRRLLGVPRTGSGGGSGSPPPQAEAEASRAAQQWLRGVPDDPGSLLRRKLQAEHQRRASGQAERPW